MTKIDFNRRKPGGEPGSEAMLLMADWANESNKDMDFWVILHAPFSSVSQRHVLRCKLKTKFRLESPLKISSGCAFPSFLFFLKLGVFECENKGTLVF